MGCIKASSGNYILITCEAGDKHSSLTIPSSVSSSSRGAEGLSGFVFSHL